MAAAAPTETLSPPINGQDSLDHPDSTEAPSEPTPDAAPIAEKRKREDPEPNPTPSEDPEKEKHPLWKTSLCSYFRRSKGSCSHGDTCRYAHGESELRMKPDNTWDPTSERAKKMARKDEGNGEGAGKKEEKGGNDVMMTETFSDEEEDGGSSAAEGGGFAKCLVHLPMKWTSDHLRNFLNENVRCFILKIPFLVYLSKDACLENLNAFSYR